MLDCAARLNPWNPAAKVFLAPRRILTLSVLIHFCGVRRFQWKRYSLRDLIPRNVPPGE